MLPPSQRQQLLQSPNSAHWQHRRSLPLRLLQLHGFGHGVVTLSQVTYPVSKSTQSWSTAVQVLFPEQNWEGDEPQSAVALQADFPVGIAGRLAAWRAPLGWAAQELAAGRPRIAARASLESEGWLCGAWAKAAPEAKRRTKARTHEFFFIRSSFG